MSVYQRDDSRFFWMHLKNAPRGKRRQSTGIPVGQTPEEYRDSRRAALSIYHKAEVECGLDAEGLRPKRADVCPTFSAFAKDYARQYIATHRGQAQAQWLLDQFDHAFGPLLLSQITIDRVLDWRAHRLTHGRAKTAKGRSHRPTGSTVNYEARFLTAVLTAAVRAGHLAVNPLAKLPPVPEAEPLRRLITPDEEARLLLHLSPTDRAIFLTGEDCLVRISNILQLGRRDFDGTHLILRQTKNGRPHRVPVSTRLREALKALPATTSEHLFPARCVAKKLNARVQSFRQAFIVACGKAGIPYGQRSGGVTFHWGTRRTGATRIIERNGARGLAMAQKVGNWKNLNTLVQIYHDVSDADMQAAVESIAAAPVKAKTLKLVRKRA